ncbi:FHA domain-containing protein [Kiritimatiellaeota bacterium B1221]|nr:FHA domain-containing protein [Kiritimatiellaeota bacterium B1221]
MTADSQPSQLRIRYTDPDGKLTELLLAEQPITVGRSPDADIITLDERASRMHCSIRIWDGEYYVKDLKSKNGTYLNHQKVEMAKIKPGDKIRLGNSILHVDDKKSPGTDTTISSVQDEMNEGKGYKTILREIVRNTESPRPDKPVAESPAPEAPRAKTAKLISEGDASEKKKPASISINKPAGSGSKIIRINKPGSR